MKRIKNYTGPALDDFAEETCAALRAADFEIVARPSSNPNRKRNLLRILWRGVYVGQMHSDLWEAKYGCLYRFNSLDRANRFRFAEPENYGAGDFMRIHHLDKSQFTIRAEGKETKRYYRIAGTEATLKVLKQSAQEVDRILGLGAESDIARDLAGIAALNLPETEKDALIKARLGQGEFRAALGSEFNWTCPSSGLNSRAALRASHIVPWREADDRERRDPLNGLLLSANLDALFDRHLLTFGRTGGVKFSKSVSTEAQTLLGPFGKLNFKPCATRASYLARHHKRFKELELQRIAIAKARDEESEADEA